MTSSAITRLKKNKQTVMVTDVLGKEYAGFVSAWDEALFAIRVENGDDVFFSLTNIAHMTVVGGLEKRSELE